MNLALSGSVHSLSETGSSSRSQYRRVAGNPYERRIFSASEVLRPLQCWAVQAFLVPTDRLQQSGELKWPGFAHNKTAAGTKHVNRAANCKSAEPRIEFQMLDDQQIHAQHLVL